MIKGDKKRKGERFKRVFNLLLSQNDIDVTTTGALKTAVISKLNSFVEILIQSPKFENEVEQLESVKNFALNKNYNGIPDILSAKIKQLALTGLRLANPGMPKIIGEIIIEFL